MSGCLCCCFVFAIAASAEQVGAELGVVGLDACECCLWPFLGPRLVLCLCFFLFLGPLLWCCGCCSGCAVAAVATVDAVLLWLLWLLCLLWLLRRSWLLRLL